MKRFATVFLAGMALAAVAKDLTRSIDTTAPKRNAFPCDVPCVGYAADPKAGDEAAALACRRAGAWLFHTTRCDDATLEFCGKYGLRLFVVLDGDQTSAIATVNRLAQSPHRDVVAGLQLGADPTGGADPSMWKKVASVAARQFPKAAVALPVKSPDSPMLAAMNVGLESVTHLVVDLRDATAPYERLEAVAKKLRKSSDKRLAKLRLWAVGPGQVAGLKDANAALAWQMHWIMSAFAVDRTDGVFVERPCRADDFGLAMRHFWAATTGNRSLVGHGEAATSAPREEKTAKKPVVVASMDDDSLLGDVVELGEDESYRPVPVACANVAAGKNGDVEYLVLLAPPVENDGQRVCLVLVNTTGERVKLSIDVNKKGGSVSSGWRRRLVPDEEKGVMRNSTRERWGNPFSETIEQGEVTFLDFRI